MASLVACLNFKGGVGKTTVSAHLAWAIAHYQRKRVLLIDLDPQYNLTQLLFIDSQRDKFFTSGRNAERLFLYGGGKVESAPNSIHRAPAPNGVIAEQGRWGAGRLDVVPGSFELTSICILNDRTDINRANLMFREFLSMCQGLYDYIFLDLNPGVSHLTFAAIEVSDFLLCTTRDDKFSPIGLRLIRDFVQSYFPEKHTRSDRYYSVIMNACAKPGRAERTQVESQIGTLNNVGEAVIYPRLPDTFLLRNFHNTRAGFMFDRRVSLMAASQKAALVEDFKQLGQAFVARISRR